MIKKIMLILISIGLIITLTGCRLLKMSYGEFTYNESKIDIKDFKNEIIGFEYSFSSPHHKFQINDIKVNLIKTGTNEVVNPDKSDNHKRFRDGRNARFTFYTEGSYEIIIDYNDTSITYKKDLEVSFTSVAVKLDNNVDASDGLLTNRSFYVFVSNSYRYIIEITNEHNITKVISDREYVRQDGNYQIKVYDKYNHHIYYEHNIIIDKTRPIGYLTEVINNEAYGLVENDLTSKDVYLNFDENEIASATLNGEPYLNKELITEEGKYELIIIDHANNKTKYNFEIDKTPIIGTIKGKLLSEHTYQYFSVSWSGVATATINGQKYTRGTTIRENGHYEIIITDRAGNNSYINAIVSN